MGKSESFVGWQAMDCDGVHDTASQRFGENIRHISATLQTPKIWSLFCRSTCCRCRHPCIRVQLNRQCGIYVCCSESGPCITRGTRISARKIDKCTLSIIGSPDNNPTVGRSKTLGFEGYSLNCIPSLRLDMDRVDYLMGDEIYTIGICGAYIVTELVMAKNQAVDISIRGWEQKREITDKFGILKGK